VQLTTPGSTDDGQISVGLGQPAPSAPAHLGGDLRHLVSSSRHAERDTTQAVDATPARDFRTPKSDTTCAGHCECRDKGPGGWETGLRILDEGDTAFDVVGVELAPNAAATAVAAGHQRIVCDVRSLDPVHPALRYVEGLMVSAPCQVWSPAGKREGHQHTNLDLLIDTFDLACEATFGHFHDSGECGDSDSCGICSDPEWDQYGGFTGPLITFEEARSLIPQMSDERIGLIAETVIWSLALTARYDNLRWLAMEQSAALPERVLEEIAIELQCADWCSAEYQRLDAADVGVAAHRRRVYLVAGRHHFVDLAAMNPVEPVAPRTLAGALGWPEGVRVNTRGVRKTSGGNEFSADRTAPGTTSKVRGWYWTSDKDRRYTVPEAALTVAMPADHPWTGSRSSACQQLADVACPTEVARVVGGAILNKKWEERVAAYLAEIYGPSSLALAAPAPVLAATAPRAAAAAAVSEMLPGLADWPGLVAQGTGVTVRRPAPAKRSP
jgi:DNA (cytosine-5)-methyltransferase 1